MLKIILLLVVIVFLVGCEAEEEQPIGTDDDSDDETDLELTENRCNQAGGNWNECGSPCAGTGAEVCIQVCKAQCECGGIAGFGCPEGYKCKLSGKVVDEVGVCVI